MIKAIYKKIVPEKTRNSFIDLLQRLKYPFLLGDKYYCSCCDKSFSKFLSKGNIKRYNAKCPYCLSLERTRVLDLYLNNEIDIYNKKDIKILHFAPERALFNKLKKINNVEYIDGDIHSAYARNIIDVTNIEYPDKYFDYIICSHVLGHVPDEAKAIKEMRRVVKDDGDVFVMTLINSKSETFEDPKISSPKDRLEKYGEDNLCRLHGNDFANRLSNQGFKVKEVDYRINFSQEIRNKYSLGDGQREIIFHCTK